MVTCKGVVSTQAQINMCRNMGKHCGYLTLTYDLQCYCCTVPCPWNFIPDDNDIWGHSCIYSIYACRLA